MLRFYVHRKQVNGCQIFLQLSSSREFVIAFQHLLQKLNKVLPNKGTNQSTLAGNDNQIFSGVATMLLMLLCYFSCYL